MRDQGLQGFQEAAAPFGGSREFARKIGSAQPPLSAGSRIPAQRDRSLESGVLAAAPLPPVLGGAHAETDERDAIDVARAQEYALLSALLARAPDAELLHRLGLLRGDASPLGLAHAALAEAAGGTDIGRVSQEYFDLFIGLGRGELMPYGSYYLTGFLHERPLARLRQDLGLLGIVRAENHPEPEDHAAILCEIMAGLIAGSFGVAAGADRQMFEKHLAPWIGRFFVDLERAQGADFYRRIGTLGRVFIQIEAEAFALPS